MSTGQVSPAVVLRSPAGRWIVLAAVLGSGMALLDGTVVNVAVKPIGEDLGAGLSELQWVVNAYLLFLASLILIGGSLGDRFGRRRMFMLGVGWFAAASLLCGIAQDPLQLIAARALQGIGGALLTPGSLAILQASLQPADRSRAIGTWSAYTGIAAAAGPLLGGWLIQAASWRWVFLINVPLAALVLVVTARHVPESGHRRPGQRFDVAGAVLGALGLAGVTYALIEANAGVSTAVLLAGVLGLAALGCFVGVERWQDDPMLPPSLFRDRTFSVVNLVTFAVYGALGAMMFLLVLQLQVSAGFSPLQAGLSMVPFTVIMLLFSSRSGALAARIGPRAQLMGGPLLAAVGVLLLSRIDASATYLGDVLPGVCLFGAGMTLLVAPLTASVLAAAPEQEAGIASGVNNAVARAAGLLFVAALPTLVGLSDQDYQDPAAFTDGYRVALLVCVAVLVAGSGLATMVPRQQQV
ncbi:MAG TPA: MFS transporter [Nocardioidaceae bacterium]|nr:MFS transporter [Nocardioidaceae bacterium]